ncbi:MAG: TerB family tellurite resistance protein [Myxococcota bacterium]
MGEAREAMASWIGTLSSGGVLRSDLEEAGVSVATYVVGEERISELREWAMAQSPEALQTQQCAAIEVCIWMANADRKLDPEEAHFLKSIILASHLDTETQDALVAAVHDPPSLRNLEKRIQHPVLRELLIALMWELAEADGVIDKREEDFVTGLCVRLEVDAARAKELRDQVVARVSLPPG